GGLGLYKSYDGGQSWMWEQDLPGSSQSVSDGTMLADGTLLLTTSTAATDSIADVEFLRMNYDAVARQWSLDPLTPTTVYASTANAQASRGTIAVDSNGVLFTAFRLQNAVSGYVRIRLFSSVDDGLTWQDTLNLFGTANFGVEKDAKVLATGTGIAVVFHDVEGTGASPVRTKGWAYRDDADPLQTPMPSALVTAMAQADGDPLGSHWSVAADSLGNIHLTYQDDRIHYVGLDAATQTWSAPLSLGTQPASYNSISVAGNGDLWVFARFNSGGNVWVKHWFAHAQQWSGWLQVSSGPHPGLLRMCSPERVGRRLPLLYQVNSTAPFELLHCMLAV
ncbi:MAG TPA: hypothetical protein VFG69_19085, partial [Nannocystaceae bacterium]|nr:hypothetical protein [Nannocystaceae bacterium]